MNAPPVATEDVKAAIGGESGADEGRLLADDRRARFTARLQGRPPASARGVVELAIDPSQLHLFDPDTGPRARRARPPRPPRHARRRPGPRPLMITGAVQMRPDLAAFRTEPVICG